jgi:hypothetical protein
VLRNGAIAYAKESGRVQEPLHEFEGIKVQCQRSKEVGFPQVQRTKEAREGGGDERDREGWEETGGLENTPARSVVWVEWDWDAVGG